MKINTNQSQEHKIMRNTVTFINIGKLRRDCPKANFLKLNQKGIEDMSRLN